MSPRPRNRRRGVARPRNLQIDLLEHRRLLTVSYDVATQGLNISGSPAADTYLVYESGANLVVEENGLPFLFPKATQPVSRISASLDDGNDYLSLEETLAIPLSANGGDGNDVIVGGAAVDILLGGDGADILTGHGSLDYLDGGSDADLISGGEGNDIIFGKSGNDFLFGNQGNDFISGGDDSNDVIYGGEGNDYLQGDEGDDWISGGEGDDTIFGDRNTIATPGPNHDVIFGGEGNDLIYGEEGDDIIDGGSGSDTLYGDKRSGPSPDDGNDTINGGTEDDTLNGNAGDDTLNGQDGNDTVYGGSGHDVIDGEAGDDELYGQDGRDELFGGIGFDFLDGGDGNDTLEGGDDDDTLEGGRQDDILRGGEGNDLIRGQDGDDEAYGDGGADEINGGDGADTLEGGSGDDLLRGGQGADTLRGQNGNDRLYGEDGDDELFGGNGLDGLAGGRGVDVLTGGNDPDRILDFYTTVLFAKNWEDDFTDKTSDDVQIGLKDGGTDTQDSYGVTFQYVAGVWTDEEVELVDGGFKILHEATGNTNLLQRKHGNLLELIRHGAHDQTPGTGPFAWNSGGGNLHFPDDMFFERSEIEVIGTVLHEVGHNWDTEWDRDAWYAISGWIDGSGELVDFNIYSTVNGDWWFLTDAEGFVADYGMESPYEDFATAFSAYFLDLVGISFTEARSDFQNEITSLSEKLAFFDDFLVAQS